MIQKTPKTPKSPAKAAKPEAKSIPFAAKGVPSPKKKLDGRAYAPSVQDRQLVMLMKAVGFTQERAARQLDWPFGIDPKTFRKHFGEDWEAGEDRVLALISGTMLSIANDKTHKNVATAGIFLLKSRFGWRDADPRTASVTVDTPPGGSDMPLRFTLKIGERDDSGD